MALPNLGCDLGENSVKAIHSTLWNIILGYSDDLRSTRLSRVCLSAPFSQAVSKIMYYACMLVNVSTLDFFDTCIIYADLDWINKVQVNLPAVEKRVQHLTQTRQLKGNWQAAWLLRAVTCIDLTTLAGDDTKSNAQRLCFQASEPIHQTILKELNFNKKITTGAVCVYPARVADCVKALKCANVPQINIASVAAGFPSGQYPLKTRLDEIRQAVGDGATEIDIVINRNLALNGDWKGVYDELRDMKLACGHAHMKSILATGELGTLTNVYKASLVAMMAGSDFIKTSTGKESVNATLPVGLVMARAIRDYQWRTGFKVGLKPAGGIRTPQDVLNWQVLMKEELGDEWTKPTLFRIGASALLSAIEQQLFILAFKRPPIPGELSTM